MRQVPTESQGCVVCGVPTERTITFRLSDEDGTYPVCEEHTQAAMDMVTAVSEDK